MGEKKDNVVQFDYPEFTPHIERSVETGGTEPPGGGMEARIAKLEAQMDAVQGDLGDLKTRMGGVETTLTDIRVQLSSISAKLDSKVDYKWLTVYALGIAAVILRNEILALLSP